MQMAYLKELQNLKLNPRYSMREDLNLQLRPFRETSMTEPNRIQLTELLGDVWKFLQQVSDSRGDWYSGNSGEFARTECYEFPVDALKYRLVDGLKYDDEMSWNKVRNLNIGSTEKR